MLLVCLFVVVSNELTTSGDHFNYFLISIIILDVMVLFASGQGALLFRIRKFTQVSPFRVRLDSSWNSHF